MKELLVSLKSNVLLLKIVHNQFQDIKPSGAQVKRPSSSSTQVTNKTVRQMVADRLTKHDNTKGDTHTAFCKNMAAE